MVDPTVTANNESAGNTNTNLSPDDSHSDQKEAPFGSSNVNVNSMKVIEENDQHIEKLQPQLHHQTDNNSRSPSMPNNPLLSPHSTTTTAATATYSSSSTLSCPNPIQKPRPLLPSSPSACTALPPNLRRILMEVAKTGHCTTLNWDYNHGSPNRLTNGTMLWSGRKRPLPGPVQTPQPPPSSDISPLEVISEETCHKNIKDGHEHTDTTSLSDPNLTNGKGIKEEVSMTKDTNSYEQIETVISTKIENKSPEVVTNNNITKDDDPSKTAADKISSSPMPHSISSKSNIDENSTVKSSTNPQQSEGELSAYQQISFTTLREALRMAVALVLDYSYKHQGGYKMNPTERISFENYRREELKKHGFHHYNNNYKQSYEKKTVKAQTVFLERRERLLKMLTKGDDQIDVDMLSKMYPSTILNDSNKKPSLSVSSNTPLAQDEFRQSATEQTKPVKSEVISNVNANTNNTEIKMEEKMRIMSKTYHPNNYGGFSPPFTIQRVAEVLVTPERYYSQTHKLCNALEKLLLVTSPNDAFETAQGENLSQNRKEGGDSSTALEERNRANSFSEQRQRRIRRRRYSDSSGLFSSDMSEDYGYINKTNDSGMTTENQTLESSRMSGDGSLSHDPKMFTSSSSPSVIGNNEMLFQMTNNGALVSNMHDKYISMQLDSTGIGAAPQRMPEILTPTGFGNTTVSQMVSHDVNVSDGMRHHLKEAGSENPRNLQENFHSSVMFNQHSVPRPPPPILFSAAPPAAHNLNQMVHEHHRANPVLQSNPTAILGGHSNDLGTNNSVRMEIVIEPTSSSPSPAMGPNLAAVAGSDVADLDGEQGSDIDSESDDVSFDDSASDRSDGSDSGSGITSHEPFNAARVMALNRIQQQQQRRENFLQNRALATMTSNQQNEPYRPPPDLEYQSGDSLDSMIAEDSGGSDSSSDVND